MSILPLLLTYLTFFLSPLTPGASPEIFLGPLQAEAGVSPITGQPSGWYTTDVTIQVLAPEDVLANGRPLADGLLTITEEGRHQVELQPGPTGADNKVTQFVDIDKSAPQVTWLSKPNSVVSEKDTLSAKITDAVSGVCSIESSLDNGLNWEKQIIPLNIETRNEVIVSIRRDFSKIQTGARVALLLARDCAGNSSPAEILVIRVR